MNRKLTNKKNYPPKCAYCAKGRLSPDGESVLCPKKGITSPQDSCRSYKYDVMKRIPEKAPVIQSADTKDFEL